MNRYGRDFNSGRYTSHGMGYSGTGYDTEFGSEGQRGSWQSDRWPSHHQGGRGWSGMGHSTSRTGLDESWGAMQHGRGQEFGGGYDRGHFGEGHMERGFGGGNRYFGGNREFGGTPNFGSRNFGGYRDFSGNRDWGTSRQFGNRDFSGNRNFGNQPMYGGRTGVGYDEDFGDRLRRGWDRFRDEARGWMGRGGSGYDRNW